MSSHVYLFFPPRGHEPPPTLRDRFNPHLSLQPRRFRIPLLCQTPGCRSVRNRPTLSPPTPSSPHCTLKVSEHDTLRQPPAAHSDERLRPQKSCRAQLCLNALTLSYLMGTVARGQPMVWSLALCSDDAKRKTRWCTVRSLA